MRGLLVPVVGEWSVSCGPWDSRRAIARRLGCRTVDAAHPPPSPLGPPLTLWHTADPGVHTVNPLATALLDEPGGVTSGPVLITGYFPDVNASSTLAVVDLLHLATRLVQIQHQAKEDP